MGWLIFEVQVILETCHHRVPSQGLPVTVTVPRDLSLNGPLIFWGCYVIQEAVVKAIPRDKLLHVLDFCWGLCSWDLICAWGGRGHLGSC